MRSPSYHDAPHSRLILICSSARSVRVPCATRDVARLYSSLACLVNLVKDFDAYAQWRKSIQPEFESATSM
jgi:hypothetical protein